MPIWMKDVIEIIFSGCLFINATLFVPQAIRIFRAKEAKSVSLLTFAGFNFIQFFIMMYGYVRHDYLLIIGYTLSLLTCGAVTALILWYRIVVPRLAKGDES